jgi:hypothetical protein
VCDYLDERTNSPERPSNYRGGSENAGLSSYTAGMARHKNEAPPSVLTPYSQKQAGFDTQCARLRLLNIAAFEDRGCLTLAVFPFAPERSATSFLGTVAHPTEACSTRINLLRQVSGQRSAPLRDVLGHGQYLFGNERSLTSLEP